MRSVLVTLADRHYLEPAKQVFASAHLAGGWKGDYLLLAHDVPELDTREFVNKGVNVRHVSPLARGLFNGWPATVISKFYLFDEFFRRWDKVVYLDGDMMVRARLDPLLHVQRLGAVQDLCDLRSHFAPCNACPVPRNGPAFNSGLLAFDTAIVEKGAFDGLVAAWRLHGPVARFPDQAILNLFFRHLWEPLPVEFNGFAHLRTFGYSWPAFLGAAIVHFATAPKPWQATGSVKAEWMANLAAFDAIALEKRQAGRQWSGMTAAGNRSLLFLRYRLARLDTRVGELAARIRRMCSSGSAGATPC